MQYYSLIISRSLFLKFTEPDIILYCIEVFLEINIIIFIARVWFLKFYYCEIVLPETIYSVLFIQEITLAKQCHSGVLSPYILVLMVD